MMVLAGALNGETDDGRAEGRVDGASERFVDLVGEHGGRPSTACDHIRFAATFQHAGDALACALALQTSFDGEDPPMSRWAIDAANLTAGDAEGPSWRRVTRVLMLAALGQVLVSRAAADLAGGSVPTNAILRDRGAPRPRDLGRPEHVLELIAVSLAARETPLRSLDAINNNLPVLLTSFVGRDVELKELARLLADAHLVTLTGPGGCGKTRLALQCAAFVVDHYFDGVWIADMAPLADPDLVHSRVAEAIGVSEIPMQQLEKTITDRLAPLVALLVIDNCEHLTDTCARLVERLVRACPRLTVVATSREPLGADGEVTWRVPSLSLPAPGADRIEVATVEAVRLFVERAQSARPTFRLDDDNGDAVAEICRRLDGIPLAIELAAARSRTLPPLAIAQQLKDRFSLLTGGRKAALPRHRTLEASLEWSYSLLDGQQRTLFARLAVFFGGFDLAAAEAVCAGAPLDHWVLLDTLNALVDKSLVVLEDDHGSGRFSMLETMRHFAMTKLIAAGEVDVVRERHADHYGAMAQTLAPVLEGPGMLDALAELGQDIDNLRSALDWRIQQSHADQAMRLATALWLFWVRDRANEGATRLAEALALGGGEPAARAVALASRGYLLFAGGDLAAMVEAGEEALVLAEQAGDDRALGRAKSVLGYGSLFTTLTDPTETLREALLLQRAVGDPAFHVLTLNGLMLAGWMTGDTALMQESVAEMVSVSDPYGSPQMRSRAFAYAALAAYNLGALDVALAHCAAASEIEATLGGELFGSIVLGLSARILALRGDYENAVAAADEANVRSQAINSVVGVAIALWARSMSLRDRGDAMAAAALEEARTLCEMLGYPFFAELALAETRVAVGEGDAGIAADRATRFAQWSDRPLGACGRAYAALATAEVALLEDDIERARGAAYAGLTAAIALGDQVLAVIALEFVAHLATLTRRHLEAARLYAAASAERGRMGTPLAPADRPRRDADLATLEAAMGDDALAAAVAEGEVMTINGAAGYAKRGRGSRRRSATGWSSLTPIEIEVVDLVSQGLRNADVAERLLITAATVKTHLRHVFAKLHVANRAELTAVAHRRT